MLPGTVDPRLPRLLAYWRSLVSGGRLPNRRDIDPTAIPDLLSAMFLLDVEAADFRFRLVGEDVVEMYGSLKGRALRELMSGPDLANTTEEHRRCVLARRPIYTRHGMRAASEGDSRLYERLLVPFADRDGIAVTCLAGIMVFRSYWEEMRSGLPASLSTGPDDRSRPVRPGWTNIHVVS